MRFLVDVTRTFPGSATAERERLIVLCDHRDFLTVASVTGQPVKLVTHAAIWSRSRIDSKRLDFTDTTCQ